MNHIILILLLVINVIYADSKYELGEGYSLVDKYLYIGGYFSTNYANSRYINGASLDDLGLLVYGSSDKFTYLSEFESLDYYQYDFLTNTTKGHKDIYTKRAFVEYQVNDKISLKVGKFYTPVGFWRDIPINVLRDTTSSPLSSQKIYPEYTTGIDITYKNIHTTTFKVDFIAQHSKDIDPTYNNSKAKEHYALSLSYNKNNFTYQAALGYYKEFETRIYLDDGDNDEDDYIKDFYSKHSDDTYKYMFIGVKYDSDKFIIQSELGRKYKNNQLDIVYMGYIQSIYRYDTKNSFILRYEDYIEDDNEKHHDDFSVIAYTYRPYYPIALKSEYQFHSITLNDKAIFSFSILF